MCFEGPLSTRRVTQDQNASCGIHKYPDGFVSTGRVPQDAEGSISVLSSPNPEESLSTGRVPQVPVKSLSVQRGPEVSWSIFINW